MPADNWSRGLEAASSGAVADVLIGQGLVPVEIREAPGGRREA